MSISPADLILNEDGSIYHLHLLPGQISNNIITVGDPDRVGMVTKYMDSVEVETRKREFVTVTGRIKGVRLTVISTGIGTDNIDIVLNELDALVNIDFKTRMIKEEKTALHISRIGTSGGLRSELGLDSFLVSEIAIGLDGLMHFYNHQDEHHKNLKRAVETVMNSFETKIYPYITECTSPILEKLPPNFYKGITVTATGFYGPQGRKVRSVPKSSNFIDNLSSVKYKGLKITNLEMETAGIYGLCQILGHKAISFNAILANRKDNAFSKQGKQTVEKLIKAALPLILNC